MTAGGGVTRVRQRSEVDILAAPAEDGGLLFWPSARTWAVLVEENRRARRACSIELAGCSVGELIAGQLSGPPIVMTGHQPGFIHPGVWAKSVAASCLAVSLGSRAEFVVVDSDAPLRLILPWPRVAGGLITIESAAVPGGGLSYEQLPPTPAAEWQTFFAGVPQDGIDQAGSTWRAFVRGFSEVGGPAGYVDRWIAGITAVERLLDIGSPRCVRVSDLFAGAALGGSEGEIGSCFVAHLLLNAESLAAAYNAALATYRLGRGIRGRQHPMPDLAADGERTESPFWILHNSQPRQRLFVSRRGAHAVQLWAGDSPLCVLNRSALLRHPLKILAAGLGCSRIRPRALALTMYARLLACDLFVHGIGGAKYDQIADDVVRRFFGVEPPAYVCASATCRLRLPRFEVTEADLLAAMRAARDLRYNPQRHAGSSLLKATAETASVLARRAAAVAEASRLREQAPGQHAERRAAFARIREANEALLAAMPGAAEAARRRLAEVGARLEHDRIARSREWFFALYSQAELRLLCAEVAARISG